MGRGRRKKRRKPADTTASKAPEREKQTQDERRLHDRIGEARRALLESFEVGEPGDADAVLRQAALQAEILGLETQLFAERARRVELEADKTSDRDRRAELRQEAAAHRKRSRQASSDAIKWHAEARRGLELELRERVEGLEQRLTARSEVAEAMRLL